MNVINTATTDAVIVLDVPKAEYFFLWLFFLCRVPLDLPQPT